MSNFSGDMMPLNKYIEQVQSLSGSKSFVCDGGYLSAEEVRKSKTYILEFYRNIISAHSFIDFTGAIYDCVPYEMQPGVRDLADKSVPVAPDLRLIDAAKDIQSGQYIGPNVRDELGNQVYSPSGTINMRRITIKDVARFGSLDNFLSKGKIKPASSDVVGVDGSYHRYAVARQSVDNIGISGKVSVHKNPIIQPKQFFSLGQMWLSSKRGTGNHLQTIEPIMVCSPLTWGHTEPTIVMYYTSKNYENGHESYNTDDGAFVLTSNSWLLGSPLAPVSKNDGDQYTLHVTVKLDSGKWWVYLGGEASSNAVGYYPTSMFKAQSPGGLDTVATYFDVGGETSSSSVEPVTFAPMGTGNLANQGWKKSAYIRDIKYYNATGTAVAATVQSISSSTGYSGQRNRYVAPWNETWWYGGPGGS